MSTEILQADVDVQAACEDLKEHVDLQTSGVNLIGSRKAISTTKCSGVEIGYRLKAFLTHMRREIFIKVPGYKIDDLSKPERDKILTAVFNVFLVPSADLPQIAQIAPDCLVIRQNVMPIIMVERSPRLSSIVGGLG
jgi:hypothetical protein